ncbi:MAG: response regulator [Bacteroidales bacterium]|nr:response regulator [Bacteroidales bacterium]
MNQNKLILFAEDSLTQAEKLKMMLEDNGYIPVHAKDGIEAFELAKSKKPDLILSDIIMPGMDGYELCRTVKKDNDLKEVPVILLTSLSDVEDVLNGLECGADNYIMKPFVTGQLISRINNVLQDRYRREEKLEQENIEILFEGKKYLVSSTRFQILNMLLSTYEGAVERTEKLTVAQTTLNVLRKSLEKKVDERTRDLQDKINERERVESDIRESEKEYRSLIENALVGVFSVTIKGQVKFINEALCKLLEYESKEKILAQNFKSLFNNPADYDSLIEKLMSSKQMKNFEVKMISDRAAKKWVILNAVIKDDIMSGMILDISDRKKTEEKEKRYQEELRKAKEKAEESDRLKSTFLSNMSHEIRTPMNAITGFSSLLSSIALTPERKAEFVERISKNCYQLLDLIKNILDLAKLEADQMVINEKVCPVNELMKDIYAKFSSELSRINKDHIKFKLISSGKDDDLNIITDPSRISQVLNKLIDNGLKFTEKGSVEFGYSIQQKNIEFYVKDTGMGLSEEQKEYVFERFRKAEDTKTKLYGGAGLGLSICKKLVELMGGRIWVQSEQHKGSHFYFTIPLKTTEKPAVVTKETSHKPDNKKLANKRILIAEDNLYNYKLLEAILTGTETEIVWAKDGLEAVECCKSDSEFDMVLMDLKMPNMDGIEATREIKKLNKQMPVLAVSAYTMADEKEKTIRAGCNDFLSKPVNPQQLMEMMQKYIDK